MKILDSKNVIYAQVECFNYEEVERLNTFIDNEVLKGKMKVISSGWCIDGNYVKEVLIFSLTTALNLRDFINNKVDLFDHGVDYHEL